MVKYLKGFIEQYPHIKITIESQPTTQTLSMLEQQRIEHERDYDTLTGLYRRRAFDRACEALFQQPEKLGCAALLMMDLDNLKQINDTYGHDWGDQYIRQTGQCFAANTPAFRAMNS